MDAKQIKEMIKGAGIKTNELVFRENKKYGYLICYYKLPVKTNVLLNNKKRPSWTFYYDFPDDFIDLTLKLMKSKIILYKKEWENENTKTNEKYVLVVEEMPKPRKCDFFKFLANDTPKDLPKYKIYSTIDDFQKDVRREK